MEDGFEERLATVERAVTDSEHDLSELAEAAESGERIDDLETELTALDDRVAELESATQALRGYVGNLRSVNREVERRADLALSTAEAAAGDAGQDAPPDGTSGSHPGGPAPDDDPPAADESVGARTRSTADANGRPTSGANESPVAGSTSGDRPASSAHSPDTAGEQPDGTPGSGRGSAPGRGSSRGRDGEREGASTVTSEAAGPSRASTADTCPRCGNTEGLGGSEPGELDRSSGPGGLGDGPDGADDGLQRERFPADPADLASPGQRSQQEGGLLDWVRDAL
jgi:hypothetical protein